MSSQKFKFVSPGIFINEIDKSQIALEGTPPGPVIIGHLERGPAMRPVKVNSFSDFVEKFGNPTSGKGKSGDVWRDGNYMAPTYAAYAAQAYLANQAPATIIRLLGHEHASAAAGTTTPNAKAGWSLTQVGTGYTVGNNVGGAYGLFVFPSASGPSFTTGDDNTTVTDKAQTALTMSLAAVFYTTTEAIAISGNLLDQPLTPGDGVGLDHGQFATASHAALIEATVVDGRPEFVGQIGTSVTIGNNTAKRITFNFDKNSEKYIRNVFNTNPTLINTTITKTANQKSYWLGETYERSLLNYEKTGIKALSDISGGVMLGLATDEATPSEWGNRLAEAKIARTGWYISQDFGDAPDYNPEQKQKLFRVHALESGEWSQRNLKISIEDIKPSPSLRGDYGSFTVAIRRVNDTDNNIVYVERFTGLNLNPDSPNYIARRIGDKTFTWVEADRALRVEGQYDNISKFIRIEMNETVDTNGHDQRSLPFGVYGPYRLKNIGAISSSLDLADASIASTKIDGFRQKTAGGINFRGVKASDASGLEVYTSEVAQGSAMIAGNTDCHLKNTRNPASATATMTALSVTAAAVNTRVLTVTDVAGNAVNFTIDNSTSTSTATVIAFSNANSNATQLATNIAAAINAADTADTLDVVAVADGTSVRLTMITEGTAGNSVADISGTAVTDGAVTIVSQWAGGAATSVTETTDWAFFVDAQNRRATSLARQGAYTGSIRWPEIPLRKYADAPVRQPKLQNAYFGVDVGESGSNVFDPTVLEPLRMLPNGWNEDNTTYTEPSWVFSLDDVRHHPVHGAIYISGSRRTHNNFGGTDAAGALSTVSGYESGSITSTSGSNALLTGSSLGYNRFTTLLHGGFDGLDITEKNPFRNTKMPTDATELNNSSFYTIKRAIDTMRDPDRVESNLLIVPGLTNSTLTDHAIMVAEERGDTLAIIDLENDFIPATENTDSAASRRPDLDTALYKLNQRGIDSSYGCAYYPFVTIRDNISNHLVDIPPSVVALGTMAYSEAVREVWFAPAGFTRGGLSRGTSGLQVVGVKHHLNSTERDKLYARNVNPIASFPAEGVVVFGQKTLQMTPSALDRINVRRLLIRVKRQISRIASTILFEQNVIDTWTKFVSQAETLLNDIKGGQGLMDFKVVLDETTTTPEMIDKNILYAKIFLKPAKAIEFIALDFIITDTGASFAD